MQEKIYRYHWQQTTRHRQHEDTSLLNLGSLNRIILLSPSMQVTLNRRFAHGLSFAAAYTYGISLKGNTGLIYRLIHNTDGTISVRSDQAQYEALNNTLDRRPHFLKVNSTWEPTGFKTMGGFVHQLTKDWQLSGILTAASGTAYSLGYGYNASGNSVNLTGSPDYGGRVVLGSGLGSGCSDDPFNQFKASAVTGPAYGSVGLESGRNYLRGCPIRNVDTSVLRRFRFWKFQEARRFEFRADIFNTLNTVIINGRNGTATFNNPTAMALQNSQYNADGTIASGRSLPKNAGFGAANSAQGMRSIQLQVRFAF